jgi:hypothetical protein
MGLLIGLFHFTMFLFGAPLRLDTVKYPNLVMLINKVAFIVAVIYMMI